VNCLLAYLFVGYDYLPNSHCQKSERRREMAKNFRDKITAPQIGQLIQRSESGQLTRGGLTGIMKLSRSFNSLGKLNNIVPVEYSIFLEQMEQQLYLQSFSLTDLPKCYWDGLYSMLRVLVSLGFSFDDIQNMLPDIMKYHNEYEEKLEKHNRNPTCTSGKFFARDWKYDLFPNINPMTFLHALKQRQIIRFCDVNEDTVLLEERRSHAVVGQYHWPVDLDFKSDIGIIMQNIRGDSPHKLVMPSVFQIIFYLFSYFELTGKSHSMFSGSPTWIIAPGGDYMPKGHSTDVSHGVANVPVNWLFVKSDGISNATVCSRSWLKSHLSANKNDKIAILPFWVAHTFF